MFINIANLRKFTLIILTIGVLIFGFFCADMFTKSSVHLPVNEHHTAKFLASEQSCCGSSISSHHDTWKNISTVVPGKTRDGLMLLAFGFISALLFSRFSFPYRPPDINLTAIRLYFLQNPNIGVLNNLKLAFARGIINPKVF